MIILRGKLRNDYDISFRRSVVQVVDENLSPEEAIKESETMIERYFTDTGEFPAATLLELLADSMLTKELKDKSPDKLTNSEYPIVSESQARGQFRRDVSIGLLGDIDEFIYEELVYEGAFKEPVERDFSGLSKSSRPQDSWAMSVKKRDRFRCQNPSCNSRNGIMHAHHILNYADYPELRTDIDNGITLCADCHYGFHSMFGNRRNNMTQLTKYFALVGC